MDSSKSLTENLAQTYRDTNKKEAAKLEEKAKTFFLAVGASLGLTSVGLWQGLKQDTSKTETDKETGKTTEDTEMGDTTNDEKRENIQHPAAKKQKAALLNKPKPSESSAQGFATLAAGPNQRTVRSYCTNATPKHPGARGWLVFFLYGFPVFIYTCYVSNSLWSQRKKHEALARSWDEMKKAAEEERAAKETEMRKTF